MRLENLYYRFSIDAGVKCTWESHKKHLFQRGKLNAFKVSIQQHQSKGFCISPCAPIKKINHFGFILPTKEIDLTIGCLPFHGQERFEMLHSSSLFTGPWLINHTTENGKHVRLRRCKHFFYPEKLAGHEKGHGNENVGSVSSYSCLYCCELLIMVKVLGLLLSWKTTWKIDDFPNHTLTMHDLDRKPAVEKKIYIYSIDSTKRN